MASQTLRKSSRVKKELQYALYRHILQFGINNHDKGKTLLECKGAGLSTIICH